MKRSILSAASVVLLASYAMASGLDGVAAEPGETVLAGPKIAVAEQRATLVQRDFDGGLVRLEERPETAALALLTLDAAEKESTEALLTDRAVRVAAALRDHTDLFLRAQNLRQGGLGAEDRQVLRALRDAIRPLLEPTLASSVEAVLSEGNRAEFRRLLAEYHAALAAASGMSSETSRGGRREPAGAAELRLTVLEMARSLGGIVEDRRERTEAILRAANATPEQERAIREILRNQEASPGAGASEEARRRVMQEIMQTLATEQRRAVAQHLRGN
jgi:hypothetical protein